MNKNLKKIALRAQKNTPKIIVQQHPKLMRHDVIKQLSGNDNIGIELGVAKGIFSKRAMESGRFSRYYGVDIYGDIHDTKEYIETLKHIGIRDNRYCLIRADFESSLALFDDETFDFIYIDGFAHSGQEGGKTLHDWFCKLKVGGILSGDDYDEKWPLVIWAVNHFASQLNVMVHTTTITEDTVHCRYPTWWIQKETTETPPVNELLVELGASENRRIHRMRMSPISKIKSQVKLRVVSFLISALEALGLKQRVKDLLSRYK